MRYLIASVVYALVVNPFWVSAQQKMPGELSRPPVPTAESPPTNKTTQESPKSELAIVGKNDGKGAKDFLFKIGETLKIKATGESASKIRTELAKTGGSKAVTLYLDNVRMAGLMVSASQMEAGKELRLNFHLERNSHDDDNRKAWDTLLKKQDRYLMTPDVALAVGNELPLTVQSPPEFQFYITSVAAIWWTVGIGIVIFFVAYYLLVKNPTVLRDTKGGPYSLSKSQMAFWGLLVVLTFAGVWHLTGTMERIPTQVLILLGISGVTGLSAVVIGENKR